MACRGVPVLGSSSPLLPLGNATSRRCFSAYALATGAPRPLRNLRGRYAAPVQAIAAPEKPAVEEKPFTAWDTAVQRVAKRTDLKTIMILGAGPIIIGQVRIDPRGRDNRGIAVALADRARPTGLRGRVRRLSMGFRGPREGFTPLTRPFAQAC